MWAISIHFNSISISFYHLLEVNGEGGFRERQGDGEAATGVKAARSGTVWDLSQGDHDDHDDDHGVNSDCDEDFGGGGVADCPAVSLDLCIYTAGGGNPLYCEELLKQCSSVKNKAIGLIFFAELESYMHKVDVEANKWQKKW